MKKITDFIIAFSLVGVVLSAYSFLHNQGFVSGEICTINATFDCDIVNKGPFSDFFGVPVAIIGLVGYSLLLVGSILKRNQMQDRMLTLFLLALASGGFGFSLYLTSVEAMILRAWCVVCVMSQIMMIGIIVSVFKLAYEEQQFSFLKKIFRR